ncbi:hypothetical protein, partial [Pseudomonas aeruginosa]
RLSMDVLYGPRSRQIEAWADLVGFTVSDINSLAILMAEADIGHGTDLDDDAIITEVFMDSDIGKCIVRTIRRQIKEIISYLPTDTIELRYLRTYGDAVYVIATRVPSLLNGPGNILP